MLIVLLVMNAGADPGGIWGLKTPPEIYQGTEGSQNNDVLV